MRKLLVAVALLALWPFAAQAQLLSKSPLGTPCSPTSCTGFYAGGWLGGNGTSADILGSGLAGSVFAGGIVPGADAGYQFANGVWFLAGEVGVGDQLNMGSATSGNSGWMAYEIVKVGGQLAGLLGTTGSITPPSALTAQLISPYGLVGAVERGFANGFATGAGATFDISPKIFLDLRYTFINYGGGTSVGTGAGTATFTNENLVTVSMNYKF